MAVIVTSLRTFDNLERRFAASSPELLAPLEEYARMTFEQLHDRLCDALRANRAPVMAEVLLPDGTHQIIRGRKTL